MCNIFACLQDIWYLTLTAHVPTFSNPAIGYWKPAYFAICSTKWVLSQVVSRRSRLAYAEAHFQREDISSIFLGISKASRQGIISQKLQLKFHRRCCEMVFHSPIFQFFADFHPSFNVHFIFLLSATGVRWFASSVSCSRRCSHTSVQWMGVPGMHVLLCFYTTTFREILWGLNTIAVFGSLLPFTIRSNHFMQSSCPCKSKTSSSASASQNWPPSILSCKPLLSRQRCSLVAGRSSSKSFWRVTFLGWLFCWDSLVFVATGYGFTAADKVWTPRATGQRSWTPASMFHPPPNQYANHRFGKSHPGWSLEFGTWFFLPSSTCYISCTDFLCLQITSPPQSEVHPNAMFMFILRGVQHGV